MSASRARNCAPARPAGLPGGLRWWGLIGGSVGVALTGLGLIWGFAILHAVMVP